MSRHMRRVSLVVVVTTLVGVLAATVATQDHERRVTIAANSRASSTNFQDADALVERMDPRTGNCDSSLSMRTGNSPIGSTKRLVSISECAGLRGRRIPSRRRKGSPFPSSVPSIPKIDLDLSPTLAVGEVGLMIEQRSVPSCSRILRN